LYLAAKVLIDQLRSTTDPAELKQLRELADAKQQVRADQLQCLGIVASAHLRRQDMANALEAGDRGFALLCDSSVVWGAYVYGAVGVCEVLLANWAMLGETHSRTAEAKAKAYTACRHAARVTRTSPVGRPHVLLLRGRAAFLSGRPGEARRHWRRAALIAERLQMRREVGLALYEIGRTSAPNDPRGPSNLARAAQIFETLGTSADLVRAEQAIST
jgi:hypothetical protein